MNSGLDIKSYAFASLMTLALFAIGCSAAKPPAGLKGVGGAVTINGQPAVEGVRIEFQLSSGDYGFTVRTKPDGSFQYIPPDAAPLLAGDYFVAVLPPVAKTIVSDSGVEMSEKASGPKDYGKFSSGSKSGIQAKLGKEFVTLDIDVKT